MTIVSLEDLNAQIQQLEAQRAQLQAEAEKQRNEAKAGLVQKLIEKIEAYGITAKDLGLNVGKADKAKRGRKPLGAEIAKSGKTGKTYTGPDGQTWSEGIRRQRKGLQPCISGSTAASDLNVGQAFKHATFHCSTSSTRRFLARPSSLTLVASGTRLPTPRATMRLASIL